ncbi:hypothetical protein N9M83_00865 [Candidatus Poseidonia alphae]|nr:hypothetical protein [Candidatus Poseidonia alphae]MDA8638994.1 hypothetical protein [Candidatus Poseidonia alphae]MDA8749117.1 hypothetical protein [Candidatus Poseidonia alphae]MDA8758770.1 hypothetical protein [Candidatus Poseidonia alphae]MDB2335407.1 hypothetical protein [Candidatus Poseidonia alphae]
MANLWQFFGLPDPEGNSNREAPSTPLRPAPTPVNVEQATLTTVEPAPVMANTTSAPLQPSSTRLQPPLNWTGPLTPDGEPFHDLGLHTGRPQVLPSKALRYVAPDAMKRIHTQQILQRVLQGDTVIVDLRPLVHMESHQMACRRELKHMGDEAGVNIFSLDQEDKLLMIPGINVVVDMKKHELGLTPLM